VEGSAARDQAASGRGSDSPRCGFVRGLGRDRVRGDPRLKSPAGGKGPFLQVGGVPGKGHWGRAVGKQPSLPDLGWRPGLSGRWWSTNGPRFGMKTHPRPP
jgi:hypothetical protein